MVALRSIACRRRLLYHAKIIGRTLQPNLNVLSMHRRPTRHHAMRKIARCEAAKRKLGERESREDS
jgi:hypothetical protein